MTQPRPRPWQPFGLAALLTALTVLTGCAAPLSSGPTGADQTGRRAPVATSPSTPQPAAPTRFPAPGTSQEPGDKASALLATLPTRGRAPRTGYSREAFGGRWADGPDGCSTRQAVLRRDVDDPAGGSRCAVVGLLTDPYTGRRVRLDEVDVDHVVALSNAWQTGAGQWTAGERQAFANDPLNLLAVSASANNQKRDGDAATWLPAAKGYRCAYVARQTAVKAAYGLWTTEAEHAAISRVLQTCPAQPVPAAAPAIDQVPDAPDTAGPSPAPRPPMEPAPEPGRPTGAVYFTSCSQARAAGFADIGRDEPGYRIELDRDADGVACQS